MIFALSLKPLKMVIAVLLIAVALSICLAIEYDSCVPANAYDVNGYIKWVDFGLPTSIMEKAMNYDIKSQDKEVKVNWIELLAYLSAKNGSVKKGSVRQMDDLVKRLEKGELMIDIVKDMKFYQYYFDAYSAVLGGLVGKYQIEVKDASAPGGKVWVEKYGLKGFSPIAKGYSFNHCRDFGNSRSFGFKRKHLGNDMMGSVGSPIIAVEEGYVEALGWNMYGGWRIGIRSLDRKRYYYYAHLRQNFPYNKALKEGSRVQAGDVIGYLGRSGYSTHENTNNIRIPHLHFGLQLIFDESQKEGNNEIWIDVYDIVELLQKNKSEVVKNQETKEFSRVYNMKTIHQEENQEQPESPQPSQEQQANQE